MKSMNFGEYKIFAGNSVVALAEEIAELMGRPLGESKVSTFSDGEISVNIRETVRGVDAFIIQSTSTPVNDNLMEVLIMVDAMKRASVGRINVVIPYYGYARQDRKAKARDPITAKLVADMISAAGADRVITMDLHAAQIQGYFDIPVDHLLGTPIITNYYKLKGPEALENLVVVSPDHGSAARARAMAEPLGVPIAIVDKRRAEANKSEVMNIIGNIEGKDCVLLDDMVDTAGTICNAAKALLEMGATSVSVCATHPVLSGPAVERLAATDLKEIVFTNTIPVPEEKILPNMKFLSVAPLFAEAMSRIHNNESVSKLFV